MTEPGLAPAFRTEVIVVDPVKPSDEALLPAASLLQAGQVVAFPTETVYGLGANALNPEAVRAVFAAKGRPADNPLIIHVASLQELHSVVARLPEQALPLIERFMPGPLTLVLPRAAHVPDVVTAGLDTVAVRMPAHPVARRLIQLAGVPVAAPSANRSGRPSPTTADHVLEDMAGRIPMVVDGGPCDFGVESTVLDVTGSVPVILRPGAVTLEDLRAVAGTVWTIEEAAAALRHAEAAARLEPVAPVVEPVAPGREPDNSGPKPFAGGLEPVAPGLVPSIPGLELSAPPVQAARPAAPRSPGMKYRHYAPRTPLNIAEGSSPEARTRRLVVMVLEAIADGSRPAVFCSDETAALLQASLPAGWRARKPGEPEMAATGQTIPLIAHGPRSQARTAASRLFAALRQLDTSGADLIIAESTDPAGIGAAYLNRLRKAAGGGPEPLADPAAGRAASSSPKGTGPEVPVRRPDVKILFVCTGNTCRSPMAAFLFSRLAAAAGMPHRAESAGLAAWPGDPISENARIVLQDVYGIDASGHHARLFAPEMAETADWILTMNRMQRDSLRRILPNRTECILTIGEAAGYPDEEVADPFGRDRAAYERTAGQLERLIRKFLERLQTEEDREAAD